MKTELQERLTERQLSQPCKGSDRDHQVDRVYRTMDDRDRREFDGKLRYMTDPAEVLDNLRRPSYEGGDQFRVQLELYPMSVVAEALDTLMLSRGSDNFKRCLQAVQQACLEIAQVHQMINDPRRGRERGEHEVFCTRCGDNTYSYYHQWICGDEEHISIEDRQAMAFASDNPDRHLL